QGCAHSRQLPRARSASAVATADRRSRRAAGRGGRDRGMAAPRGGDGGVARGSADATPAAAGRTLRGGRLRLVLSLAAVARGGGGRRQREGPGEGDREKDGQRQRVP